MYKRQAYICFVLPIFKILCSLTSKSSIRITFFEGDGKTGFRIRREQNTVNLLKLLDRLLFSLVTLVIS